MSIHKNYLKLTADEKKFVDEVFTMMRFAAHKNAFNIPLNMSDPAECAVEAIATWVIESRPKPSQEVLDTLNKGVTIPFDSTKKPKYDFRSDRMTEEEYRITALTPKAKGYLMIGPYTMVNGECYNEMSDKQIGVFTQRLIDAGYSVDETW